MKINELVTKAHQHAKDKGFYDDGAGQNIGERLALIHAEVSEALEASREGNFCPSTTDELDNFVGGVFDDKEYAIIYKECVKGSFEEEMADIVIRVADMCGSMGIDLEAHIKAKMRYNTTRPRKHGKSF